MTTSPSSLVDFTLLLWLVPFMDLPGFRSGKGNSEGWWSCSKKMSCSPAPLPLPTLSRRPSLSSLSSPNSMKTRGFISRFLPGSPSLPAEWGEQTEWHSPAARRAGNWHCVLKTGVLHQGYCVEPGEQPISWAPGFTCQWLTLPLAWLCVEVTLVNGSCTWWTQAGTSEKTKKMPNPARCPCKRKKPQQTRTLCFLSLTWFWQQHMCKRLEIHLALGWSVREVAANLRMEWPF